MPDDEPNIELADIPDLSKLQEHGVSIDAPTPTHFAIPDPWNPAGNGAFSAPGDGPAADGPGAEPAPGSPASRD